MKTASTPPVLSLDPALSTDTKPAASGVPVVDVHNLPISLLAKGRFKEIAEKPPARSGSHWINSLIKPRVFALHRLAEKARKGSEKARALYQQKLDIFDRKTQGAQVQSYRVLEGLGQGASGSVFSVVENSNPCGKTLADKVTREVPGHHREWGTVAEADLLRTIDHPNIVKEVETFFREARDTGTGKVLWEKHSILDNGGQPLSVLIDGLGMAQCSEAATGDMASHIEAVRRAAAEPSGVAGESAPDTSESVSGPPRRLDKLALLLRDYQHPVGDMHAIALHPLPVAQVQSIMHQLGAALDYLHNTQQVVHCDIKPDNLLIDPANGHVTLCDFDRAISLADTGAVVLGELAAGTLDYMPPEVLDGFLGKGGRDEEIAQFPCAVDSWATGCVLYELLCAQVLFPSGGQDDAHSARSLIIKQRDQESLHKGIAGHIDALVEQEAGGLSHEQAGHIKTLLKGLLEYDPARRMTIRQLLEQPFLREAVQKAKEAEQREAARRVGDSGQP